MSGELRKRLYEHFAGIANAAGAKWSVLSGIDGYPEGIGRDLDVACAARKDADRLCEIFVSCLRQHEFRWIVYPSPIWGRRIMGISRDYETAELHIVHPIRVGTVTLKPDWSAIEYVEGVFPSDPLARFFKRCLMPALAGSAAWQRKCAELPAPGSVPWWMRTFTRKVKSGPAITNLDRLEFYGLYMTRHPLIALDSFCRWCARRLKSRNYPAAPVYQLNGTIDPEVFLSLSQRLLSEVFTGFACIDDLSPNQVRDMQAAQRLVFLSKARSGVRDVCAIPDN
ncbi:MAG TPA: hypothetical protein VF089_06735, partial [Candidatus Binatia bacterium]